MYWLFKRYAAASCLTLFLTFGAGYLYAQESEEHTVKAAFIYHFTKFIEWPAEFAIAQRAAIDICVIGESNLSLTGDVFQKASTAKLKISLVKETSYKNATSHCHVVFVSENESGKLEEILTAFRGKPVLTVSDIDSFAERGGMIEFVMVDDKIKLVINSKSIAENGLRVDAQLLETAVKVIDR